jgi:hypothetical protein
MFNLKRFRIRTGYSGVIRPVIASLFSRMDRITVIQQFTHSPEEFLMLAEIVWKGPVEDPAGELMRLNESFRWLTGITMVDHEKRRTLCFMTGNYDRAYVELFKFTTQEFRCFIEFPLIVTKEWGEGGIVGPPPEVERLLEFMKEWGADQRIVSVREYFPVDRGILSVLTDAQLRSLKMAYSMGFFEDPRKHTARQIAKKLGIAHTTFLTHIRKSQERIIGELLES